MYKGLIYREGQPHNNSMEKTPRAGLKGNALELGRTEKPLCGTFLVSPDQLENRGDATMQGKLDLTGAVVAHVIIISTIVMFISRILFGTRAGHWFGIPILLMFFPLVYLLIRAPQLNRPSIYYRQIGLMIAWLIVIFIFDYILHTDFRNTLWMVVVYYSLYLMGMQGIMGIASLAGSAWALSSFVLFLISLILAFIQHQVTGLIVLL
jgi:hypothetical protein